MTNEFQIKYSEGKCYVCGKIEEDLKPIRNLLIKKITSELDKIKTEEKRAITILGEIISDSYPTEYLDFKISTITSDRKKFADRIPHLEILLKYNRPRKHNPFGIKDRSNKESIVLGDLRKKIIDDPKIFWENNDFIVLRARMTFLEEKIQTYQDDPSGYFKLEIANHQIDDVSSVAVHICPICSGLFAEASDAAYNTLRRDDDDDDW